MIKLQIREVPNVRFLVSLFNPWIRFRIGTSQVVS